MKPTVQDAKSRRRNGDPAVELLAAPPRSFPFGGWSALLPGAPALSRLAEPTDDDLLDDMGL
jgi:hypothetical protein